MYVLQPNSSNICFLIQGCNLVYVLYSFIFFFVERKQVDKIFRLGYPDIQSFQCIGMASENKRSLKENLWNH